MRGLLVLLAFAASGAGCSSGPPPENGSPGFPSPAAIEVRQAAATEAPVIEWTGARAHAVEVRHVRSGRVVWRIEGAVTPHGPRTIASPLAYGAPALPPGVNPPDGPDYRTTVAPEPLAPGERYAVSVTWPDGGESSAAFVASDTIPMDE